MSAMRIAMFDEGRIGVVAHDETLVAVNDLLERYEPLGPEDLLPDLINHFADLRSELEQRIATGGGRALTEARLHAPLARPGKIVCLIGNYREGTDRPIQILDIFFKSPEGISGDGDTVTLPPHDASIFHHEAELAVVIGRETKDVAQDAALKSVFGYTGYNDVSARGIGREGIASFLGKSFDTFAGFGPWIVTADEIPDPQQLHVTVDVNGERRQDYGTTDMERPVSELIAYISSVTTLHPGDVICCGTNHQGLGSMQQGDAVTTTVQGIGSFTLHVEDPQGRAWQRGVDLAMAQRVKDMAQNPAPSTGQQPEGASR
jgi:2-keto-4-pentenoate hydratase/2-oxohepta-3-ene-1,7-dioic acid hydratase in catechol pathway